MAYGEKLVWWCGAEAGMPRKRLCDSEGVEADGDEAPTPWSNARERGESGGGIIVCPLPGRGEKPSPG